MPTPGNSARVPRTCTAHMHLSNVPRTPHTRSRSRSRARAPTSTGHTQTIRSRHPSMRRITKHDAHHHYHQRACCATHLPEWRRAAAPRTSPATRHNWRLAPTRTSQRALPLTARTTCLGAWRTTVHPWHELRRAVCNWYSTQPWRSSNLRGAALAAVSTMRVAGSTKLGTTHPQSPHISTP